MKLLLITPNIPSYRMEVYQSLAHFYDLTILHSGDRIIEPKINFMQLILTLKKIGPFYFFKDNLNTICKSFDVVISEANLHYIDRNLLILNPFRKYKWIAWGIGVSASYKSKFDAVKTFDSIRFFIFKRAEANIFYSEYPIKKYLNAGLPSESLFVANNTTSVNYNVNVIYKKEKIIFVGTLYRQKKIYDLLNAYKAALSVANNLLPLDIIGAGPELNSINNWLVNNGLQNQIKLLGPIYKSDLLEKHFRSALACISPGQAGLSVLTSMGYGTPFITKKDAITGGEIFNIKDNFNGILYEKDSELVDIVLDITKNSKKYIEMGENARKYYLENRTIDMMVNEIKNAINYVLHK